MAVDESLADLVLSILSATESVVTVGAIIIGGAWTYVLFIKNREHLPHAQLETAVGHLLLSASERLVHVTLLVSNVGSVLLSIRKIQVHIHNITPYKHEPKLIPAKDRKKERLKWPARDHGEWEYEAGSTELEPTESDSFHFDLIVPADTQIARVYCYVKNEAKPNRKIGWKDVVYVDLQHLDNEIGAVIDGDDVPDSNSKYDEGK